MPGIKRNAQTAFAPTLSLSSLLSSFLEGDSAASQAAASRLARIAYSAKKEPDPAWPALKTHLEKQNGFSELLSVISIAAKTSDVNLMASTLGLCAAVLSLPPPTIVDAQDEIRKALTSKETTHLASLSRALAFQKGDLNTAALRVVRSLLQSGHGARRVWEGINIEPKVLVRLLNTRRDKQAIDLRRPDVRTLTLLVLLPLLSSGSSPALKAEILKMKGFANALLKDGMRDPKQVLDGVFEMIYHGIFADERLDVEVKANFAEAIWEHIVKLFSRTDEEDPASSAQRFLLASSTLLSKTLSRSRKVLGGLLGHLKPTEDERQALVVETALQASPELLRGFWQRFTPSLDPRISTRWLASIAFATRIACLPLPLDYKPDSFSVTALLDQSLPSNFTQQWFAKALQTGNNGLVSYMSATFLLACLGRAREIASRIKDDKLATSYRDALRERAPDAQIIIGLIQKVGAGNTSDTASVVSTQSEEFEAGGATLSTCLRLLELYFELLDPTIRFDFNKLNRLLVVTTDPFACSAQASLLRILCSPLATFTWQKALSPLIKLYLDTPSEGIKMLASNALTHLLERSPLFEHDASEVQLWLDALGLKPPISLLLAFEKAVQVGLANSTKHAEAVTIIFAEPVSPLISVLLKTLGEANTAQQVETIEYLHRLALQFALSERAAVDVAQKLVERIDKGTETSTDEEVKRTSKLAVESMAALGGAAATGKRKHGKGSSPLPLSQNIFMGKKSSSLEDVDTQLVLLHAVAARSFDQSRLLAALQAVTPNQKASLTRLLCIAALNLGDDGPSALALVKSMVKADASLLSAFVSFAKLDEILASPRLAADALQLVSSAVAGKSSIDLKPVLDQLAALLQSDSSPLEQVGPHLQAFLPLFSLDQVCGITDSLLSREDMSLALSSVLSLFLERLLEEQVDQDRAVDICFRHFRALYRLHGEHRVQGAGAMLARGVESSLPRGLLPGYAEPRTAFTPAWFAVFSAVDADQMTAWTQSILDQDHLDEADARILAAVIYRHPASRKLFESQMERTLERIEPAILLKPIHAFLETGLVVSAEVAGMQAPLISRYVVRPLGSGPDGEALVSTLAISGMLARIDAKLLNEAWSPLAESIKKSSLPVADVLTGLADLAKISSKALPLLSAYIDGCLLWLVRRYAEDEEDSESVLALAAELDSLLQSGPPSLAVQTQLVDPVLQAIVKNRLSSSTALAFATSLVSLSDKKDATCLRLLRQVAAHAQLKDVMSSNAAAQLVAFITALCRTSPSATAQSSIAEVLMPYYGATASSTDQGLLALFQLSEQSRGRSLRHALLAWAPPALRRSSDARGTTVLTALDPIMVYRACLRVVSASSEPDSAAYDPQFVLLLLSIYLEDAKLSFGDWLGLAEANVLGLAVCCLASSDDAMHSSGDRALAKLANRLEESEFAERDEFTLVFDHIRAAINAQSPLPALATLFYSKCLQAIAAPDDVNYPRLMSFLLQRPVFDLEDVPLLYKILYSREEDAQEQTMWLLELLRDGLCTERDWAMLKPRRTIDLLLSLLTSGAAQIDERLFILQIIGRAVELPMAARDLIGRRGLLSWPLLSPPSTSEESRSWLEILERASKNVDVDGIGRHADARTWLADLLLAVESLKADDSTALKLKILRRVSRYARAEDQHVVRLLSTALKQLFRHSIPPEAAADAHDAAIRCLRLGGDQSLFEPAVGLAMAVGAEDVRQWVIASLHA